MLQFSVGVCIIFNKFLLNVYLFQNGGVAFRQKKNWEGQVPKTRTELSRGVGKK